MEMGKLSVIQVCRRWKLFQLLNMLLIVVKVMVVVAIGMIAMKMLIDKRNTIFISAQVLVCIESSISDIDVPMSALVVMNITMWIVMGKVLESLILITLNCIIQTSKDLERETFTTKKIGLPQTTSISIYLQGNQTNLTILT